MGGGIDTCQPVAINVLTKNPALIKVSTAYIVITSRGCARDNTSFERVILFQSFNEPFSYYFQYSRVCYGIMRASLEVNVHFHTNEST